MFSFSFFFKDMNTLICLHLKPYHFQLLIILQMFSEKKAHRNYPICKIFSSRLCTIIYCFSIYFNQFVKILSYCYVVFTFQVKTLRLSASLRYPYFMSSLKWIVLFRFEWDLYVKNFVMSCLLCFLWKSQ